MKKEELSNDTRLEQSPMVREMRKAINRNIRDLI